MKSISTYLKNVLILIGVILIQLTAYSQDHFKCSVVGGPNSIGPLPKEIMGRSSSGPYNIMVYAHAIRRDDCTDGVTEQQIDDAVAQLNADFNPHNIFFFRDCEINEICDSDIFGLGALADLGALNAAEGHCDGIDIFFGSTTIGSGGYALDIPSTAFIVSGTRDGLLVMHSHIISHEMGHCLGLYHTYHGAEGSPDPNEACEWINGLNSSYAGDYVEDTPADPRAYNTSENNCTGDSYVDPFYPPCVTFIFDPLHPFLGIIVDENGEEYQPLPAMFENIMSEYSVHCMELFTPGQGERMCDIIETSGLFDPVLDPETVTVEVINTSEACVGESTFIDFEICLSDCMVAPIDVELFVEIYPPVAGINLQGDFADNYEEVTIEQNCLTVTVEVENTEIECDEQYQVVMRALPDCPEIQAQAAADVMVECCIECDELGCGGQTNVSYSVDPETPCRVIFDWSVDLCPASLGIYQIYWMYGDGDVGSINSWYWNNCTNTGGGIGIPLSDIHCHTYPGPGTYTVTVQVLVFNKNGGLCSIDDLVFDVVLTDEDCGDGRIGGRGMAGNPNNLGYQSDYGRSQVEVYPNPVSGILTIDYNAPNDGPVTFSVYNSLGALVEKLGFDALEGPNRNSIDFSGRNPGVYYLECKSGNQIVGYKKIVRQ